MHHKNQPTLENSGTNNQPLGNKNPATASISVSLYTILPTARLNFLRPPKISSLLASHSHPINYKVKVPSSQVLSLSHLSLTLTSSSSLSPPKPFLKKSITVSLLGSSTSAAAEIYRASIVWFRNDLRVHDNECLNSANNESISVLPVYCFDPRDYGKSAYGFGRIGPSRATFLINFVSNLRKSLQARGSDLVVRVGKPETVLVELAKEIGADAVYAHREVSHDEVKLEEKIEAAMKEEGIEVNYVWGSSTLYHVDDLPFKIEEITTDYDGFREKVQGLEVRKPLEALNQLRGLSAGGDVEPGEIPSLVELGILNSSATTRQGGNAAAKASLTGGEMEALEWLEKLAAECQAPPHNKGNNDSKISPWLAMGCLSPRSMVDELKKSAFRTFSAASNRKGGGSGPSDTAMNWWMHELAWVDFFRFITKKYNST